MALTSQSRGAVPTGGTTPTTAIVPAVHATGFGYLTAALRIALAATVRPDR